MSQTFKESLKPRVKKSNLQLHNMKLAYFVNLQTVFNLNIYYILASVLFHILGAHLRLSSGWNFCQ